ncbi:MAG: U32 family peptidase [Desulfobulbaceae bacterium]|nr:U32 family peptidase [Desulfobulbaceae bacterium]
MLSQKLELLAPAKNLACGMSAINHGADAIYIGGPQFGARAAASNSLADIEKLVAHAHQFRARVYVALNTIFDDRELDFAVGLSHQLHGIGVDALIIQDVGLLESDLPPIPLHSSTQMNNRTADKVRFLEKVGFQQVVLARELSLDQIKEIRAATSVPLEFFVHGALCVSYSGQCYISEVMAGRSANRGECAQFCRHKFTLKDGQGKVLEKDRYLLSLKDLNLSAHLRALIYAGVSSFKIEGRLKDENYVKNVTAYYRQALDKIIDGDEGLQGSSSGRCSFGFTPDPSKSFNRGKTDYFLTTPRNTPGAIDSPKSTGQRLGQVVRAEKRFFILETEEVINNGDGLCFFDPARGLVGIKVNRVESGMIYPKDPVSLPVGTTIYRNSDTAFNKLLVRSELCRTIATQLELKETTDGLLMRVRDEDGIVSETTVKVGKSVARQAGMVTALAEKQLRKSGGSVFSIDDVCVDLRPELFFPAAVFNDLRRRGFARHLEIRLQQYQLEPIEGTKNDFPWPADEISYLDNITNRKAEAFYGRHGVVGIDRKILPAADVEDCALMTTKYCVRAQLGICPKMGNKTDGIAGPLTIMDNTGEYELGFDCLKCEMTVRKVRSIKGK